jgi:hypothetical protein
VTNVRMLRFAQSIESRLRTLWYIFVGLGGKLAYDEMKNYKLRMRTEHGDRSRLSETWVQEGPLGVVKDRRGTTQKVC